MSRLVITSLATKLFMACTCLLLIVVVAAVVVVVFSYAKIHESACSPPCMQKGMRELSSDGVNAELAQWEPTYDYGCDSVFSVSPPQVSADDEAIYHKSCGIAENGAVHVPSQSLLLYSKYIKLWSFHA